jgi:outer membrane protein, heavy metal efflux system
MLTQSLLIMACCTPLLAFGQTDSLVLADTSTLDLSFLVAEAMLHNPEVQGALSQWNALEAGVPQAGSVPSPELRFRQEEMPGLNFGEAMYSRFELMQTIPFPTKLAARTDIAAKVADHAHHDHLEKANEVIARLKRAYYELWFIQQSTVLERENARLIAQVLSIAGKRYTVGAVSQQDILKAELELSMVSTRLISLRQQELSSKALLMSILNRSEHDTLAFAVIPEEYSFRADLDSLIALAMRTRPMIQHESLRVEEGTARLSLARSEYIPDVTIGVERVTSPLTGFRGWGVSAGITLPFAPWSLGRVSAGIEEAEAQVDVSRASFEATRLMVIGAIKDLYYKADGFRRQLDLYRQVVLPQARQSLSLGLTSYETGQTSLLMLIDAYRSSVNYTREYFMMRLNFEQTMADLEREVGTTSVSASR